MIIQNGYKINIKTAMKICFIIIIIFIHTRGTQTEQIIQK